MPADLKSHLFNALINAWGLIVSLAPYVAAGIVIGALVSALLPRERAMKLLHARSWWILPVGALAGLASPACTMGTVPIFAAAIRAGASAAPAATFLVASTLLNPQMFLLALGALGIKFALFQVAASLLLALFVGLLVAGLTARGFSLTSFQADSDAEPRSASHRHTARHSERETIPWRRFVRSLVDLTEFVGFYFVMGTVVAALVAEFVPAGFVIGALGEKKLWAVPVAAVASVPVYVCGGGMIPFLEVAGNMGMAAGAILAVLIAGPATRITALAALAVVFKKRVVLAYAVLVVGFAIIVGIALGGLLALPSTSLPRGAG
jgi:uncharacterized membrane protein YraQ (UPF0718 family)